MFIKFHRFSTVCEQVTTCHMAKEQESGFESDPWPFAACLRLSPPCFLSSSLLLSNKGKFIKFESLFLYLKLITLLKIAYSTMPVFFPVKILMISNQLLVITFYYTVVTYP